MKNVLSLTPGSISIISDKRELAGMGEIRMEEKRHSFSEKFFYNLLNSLK